MEGGGIEEALKQLIYFSLLLCIHDPASGSGLRVVIQTENASGSDSSVESDVAAVQHGVVDHRLRSSQKTEHYLNDSREFLGSP